MEFNEWNGKSFSQYVGDLVSQCQDFLTFCDTVKERYFTDKDVEDEMNKLQNDLLHTLEFDDLNYHGIARVGKEIRALRKNRRGYKNDYIMNEAVKNLAKDENKMRIVNEFLGIITVLRDELEKTEDFIISQKYNKRSKIENIAEMKIEDSDEESNKRTEDLISLNRVLSKYAKNVICDFDDNDDFKMIAKLQLDSHFSIKGGTQYLKALSDNVEKYYRISGKPCTTDISISDMVLQDEYYKNTLMGIMTLSVDGDEYYKVHITIRSGKKEEKKKSSKKGSKKRGKKRK